MPPVGRPATMIFDLGGETVRLTAKDTLIDVTQLDFNHVIADLAEIRRYNPQRFAAEQLTAVIYENKEEALCVGYKDVTDQEFWVSGHMPGMPLMPGVMICEAAAQMCAYFTLKYDLLGAQMVGLGGLEEIRFRDVVRPGDRLVVACKQLRVRRGAMIICRFEAYVRGNMVADGKIKGIPLPVDELVGQPKTA
jgi:3-hydroxyacyl-[acyl-carrier-protein] dehydratase